MDLVGRDTIKKKLKIDINELFYDKRHKTLSTESTEEIKKKIIRIYLNLFQEDLHTHKGEQIKINIKEESIQK